LKLNFEQNVSGTGFFNAYKYIQISDAFGTELTAAGKYSEEEDSWLPCCSRGLSDMNYADANAFKSAREILDCTCIKVPAKAQFPR
jgi:hypothetical protein